MESRVSMMVFKYMYIDSELFRISSTGRAWIMWVWLMQMWKQLGIMYKICRQLKDSTLIHLVVVSFRPHTYFWSKKKQTYSYIRLAQQCANRKFCILRVLVREIVFNFTKFCVLVLMTKKQRLAWKMLLWCWTILFGLGLISTSYYVYFYLCTMWYAFGGGLC